MVEIDYSALLLACDMCRKWREALRTLTRMKCFNVKLDNIMVSLALRACEHESEGWNAGLELFDSVTRNEQARVDCPPDKVIYSTAIKICGKARLWDRAEEILKQRHTLIRPPDERDYSQLINAAEKNKDGRRAVIWMKSMKKYNIVPSVFSFNAAISACGKSWMPGQAVQFLEQLKQTPYVDPTVVSYGSVITACERSNLWRNALAFFDEMQVECCPPNAPTYNATILACAKGHQWDHVIALVKQLMKSNVRPTGATLLAVLTGCNLIRGHGEDCLDFLRESGRTWNVEPGPNHYKLALLCCVKDHKDDLVQGIISMMERFNVSGRHAIEISTILLQCMHAKDSPDSSNVDKLLATAEEAVLSMKVQRIEPDRSLYNIVIQTFSHLGAYHRALQFFEEMSLSTPQKGDSLYPNHNTYLYTIEASGQHFELEKALSLFEKAKKNFQGEELFCAAIRACGQCLEWKLALSIFQEMEQSWRPLNGVTNLPTAITNMTDHSNTEDTSSLGEEVHSDSYRWDASLDNVSSIPTTAGIKGYTEVLAACYKSKQYDVNEEIWSTILADVIEPDAEAYGIMFRNIAHSRDDEETKTDKAKIDAPQKALAEKRLVEETTSASDTKETMETMVSTESKETKETKEMKDTEDTQKQKKQITSATKIARLHRMWTHDMKLSNSIVVEPSCRTYSAMMSSYIVLGDYQKALEISRASQDRGYLDEAFNDNELLLSRCPLASGSDGQIVVELAEAVLRLFIEDCKRKHGMTFKVFTYQPRIAKMTKERKQHLHSRVVSVLQSLHTIVQDVSSPTPACVTFTIIAEESNNK